MFGFKSFLQKRAEEKLRKEREKVQQSNFSPSRPTYQSTPVDDGPTFAQLMLYQSMLNNPSPSAPHTTPTSTELYGQGGTFDGGGASGDWSSSSSSSCESSSYSSSDSSSSCSSSDSSSSSSSSD